MKNKYRDIVEKMYERNMLIITILILIGVLLLIPLLLLVPPVKNTISFLLSFTNNASYKVVLIELYGGIIGSFIAIYGALWVQRKIVKAEKIREQRKYASVVYYDLDFAFKDLMNMLAETKRIHKVDKLYGEEGKKQFCSVALGKKLNLNPNWIVDVSQLCDVLDQHEIRLIYKCYSKLVDFDRAMQSNNRETIKNVFVCDVGWLIAEDDKSLYNDIDSIMKKLNSLL